MPSAWALSNFAHAAPIFNFRIRNIDCVGQLIAEANDPTQHEVVEITAEDDGKDIKQRRHAVGAVHGLCRCPQCRDLTLNPGADWR